MRRALALAAFCAVSCTQQQAQTAVNGVFTVDQAACIVANAGLAGTSTAVQDFEVTCDIAEALEPAVEQLVADLSPAAQARLRGAK